MRQGQTPPTEEEQDLFVPAGRVCIKRLATESPIMPGHSVTFEALSFRDLDLRGKGIAIDYRIDAEDMPTVSGTAEFTLPCEGYPFSDLE